MQKLKDKDEDDEFDDNNNDDSTPRIPPKVAQVFTTVGEHLKHYRSGKLPKALKMLPHLKHWEEVLWLTRPDLWSPQALLAATRVFISSLSSKFAQRFLHVVLLERIIDDIENHGRLNFHLYLALKKSLFKPAAFFKGILLPLAGDNGENDTQGSLLINPSACNVRIAIIVSSILNKVSIPVIHSAAALLRLSILPSTPSCLIFMKTLINKKYALPKRVLTSIHHRFMLFFDYKNTFHSENSNSMSVLWHQTLLSFIQRYKFELDEDQINDILELVRVHNHHEITPEIRREIGMRKVQGNK